MNMQSFMTEPHAHMGWLEGKSSTDSDVQLLCAFACRSSPRWMAS